MDLGMLEKGAAAAGTGVDEEELESGDDGLASRVRRRLSWLKAETTKLDRRMEWWKHQVVQLEELLKAEHEPTEEYLRAEARLSELETEVEALLKKDTT